jgi:hypothetical protein
MNIFIYLRSFDPCLLALVISLTFHEYSHAGCSKFGHETPVGSRLTTTPQTPYPSQLDAAVEVLDGEAGPGQSYNSNARIRLPLWRCASGPLSTSYGVVTASIAFCIGSTGVHPVRYSPSFEFLHYFMYNQPRLMLFNLIPSPQWMVRVLAFLCRQRRLDLKNAPILFIYPLGLILIGHFSGFNIINQILNRLMTESQIL